MLKLKAIRSASPRIRWPWAGQSACGAPITRRRTRGVPARHWQNGDSGCHPAQAREAGPGRTGGDAHPYGAGLSNDPQNSLPAGGCRDRLLPPGTFDGSGYPRGLRAKKSHRSSHLCRRRHLRRHHLKPALSQANTMEAARKIFFAAPGPNSTHPSSTSSSPRQTPSGKTCAKASCVTALPFLRSDTPSAISLKGNIA